MPGFGTQFGSKRFGMELDDSPLVVPSPWLNRFYTDFTLPPSMGRFLGGGSITEASVFSPWCGSGRRWGLGH